MSRKPFYLILLIAFSVLPLKSQTWIWFPGDFENWLGNQMNNRRTERGVMIPVQWKLDGHEPLMIFTKSLELEEAEQIEVYAEGSYTISLGWRRLTNGNKEGPTRITLPAGSSQLNIKVLNYAGVPAIFVKGRTVNSDSTWIASPLDARWMTKNMKHPDSPSAYRMAAGSGNLDDPLVKPSEFKLETRPMPYREVLITPGGRLYDFGKETFGFVKFLNLAGSGQMTLQYGETAEEALDGEDCETFFTFNIPEGKADYTAEHSNALRYLYIVAEDAEYDSLHLLYEYAPLDYRASFTSNDSLINKIWEVSRYTMQLTTRELYIDGIKRDRWAWSGDACQSYLMNYYLFFDTEIVKRTMYTLRGNDPVICHLNNILDYTFYWFIGIYDYYMYTGDAQFLRQVYPKMESLMDFVLERRNERGLVEGLEGDWVYIDWLDHEADKSGEVSIEQILFCKSLESMALCAEVVGVMGEAQRYDSLAADVKDRLADFWDSENMAFVFNRKDGVNSELITKHANMFAIFYDYVDSDQKEEIKNNVILNPNIPAISTPYMRFYELEAMCTLGEHNYVLQEMKDYWGGMLSLGATSFWEKYNPEQQGLEHYSMYGRPFGKSLCHAWGASPAYLLGRYYAGVKPVKPGYEEFEIRPVLGGLEWFEATVPIPEGEITVQMDKQSIRLNSSKGEGYLIIHSRRMPRSSSGTFEKTGEMEYRLPVLGNGEDLIISYKAI